MPLCQAIRRLARRGGVKRISGLIYEETRGVLKNFLEDVRTGHHPTRPKTTMADSPAGYSRFGYLYRARKEVGVITQLSKSVSHMCLCNQKDCHRTGCRLRPQAFWAHPLRLRRLSNIIYSFFYPLILPSSLR
jgi:hypothetical protein